MSALPDDADPAPEAESVDGGDDRHLALVHRGEGGEASAVGADQRLVPQGLDLLDVHAGAEPPSLGPDDDHPVVRDPPGGGHPSARSNQPATSRALTGGWSMTTSAMPGRFWCDVMGMTCSSGFGGGPRRRLETPGASGVAGSGDGTHSA